MNMQLTLELIQLGLVLMICGRLLTNWEPPIKAQYRFMILAVIGIILGTFLGCGGIYGAIGAGLVFYKDKLVEEMRLVRESLVDINRKK